MIIQLLNFYFSNIYSIISQISFSQAFKFICICLFILINLYFFFFEHQLFARETEQPKVLQAGIIDSSITPLLKNIGKGLIGASSVYGGWVSFKQDRGLSSSETMKAREEVANLYTEIKSLQSQLNTSSAFQTQTKTQIQAISGRLSEQHQDTMRRVEHFLSLQDELKIKTNELSKTVLKTDKDALISSITALSTDQAHTGDEIRRSLDKTTKLQAEIEQLNTTHESGWWLDFSIFTDYYDSLNTIGKFALSLLIFNQIILSAITSIVFIFYGEYLIKRYKIEERYPKLATIIKLRRKFQSYYLLISVAWIYLIVLIESIFCILIITS